MKKLITLLAMLTFIVAACGGSKEKKPEEKAVDTQPVFKVQVVDSAGAQPEWVDEESSIGKLDGKKVIFFKGFGESTFKDGAKEAAELNAATAAAAAIKLVATKQVARAWEIIGAGDNETKEQVMKGMEAISAKNVDVTGLMKGKTWWRQIMKPNIVNGQQAGWSKPVFEYYVRYSMDYATYEGKRDGIITQQKKEVKLNERQQKLYSDMEAKLDELDKAQENK